MNSILKVMAYKLNFFSQDEMLSTFSYLLLWTSACLFLTTPIASGHGTSVYRVLPGGSSTRGWYSKAAVASDSKACAEVALKILRLNGSAVDAGIASQLCNGVVDQPHMGIGGGSISLIYARPRTGGPREAVYISGDCRAPHWMTKSTFSGVKNWNTPYKIINEEDQDLKLFLYRSLSVGIPGELAGYYLAWQRYGKLPWSEIVQPSIDLAENGFRMTKAVESVISEYIALVKFTPSLYNYFSKDDIFLSKGDMMTDKLLAGTLRKIATDPITFYKGALADDIVSDLHEYGAKLDKESLSNYTARVLKPVVFPLMNGKYNAYVPGNPFGGQLYVLASNIMEGYNMSAADVSTADGMALFYHRFLETWKFVHSHIDCIGDSYKSSPKCMEFLARLEQKDYADYIRSLIRDDSVLDDHQYKMMESESEADLHGTSHLNIIADDGSAFLSTSSINTEFGWRFKGTKTGIIFNNRLNDFTRVFTRGQPHPENDVNYSGPDKQGRSFRMPMLVLDKSGEPVLGIGASGGWRIMMAVLQDVYMHTHFGMNLKDAIDFPRVVTQPANPKDKVFYDDMDKEIIEKLQLRGQLLRHYFPSMPYTAVTQGVSMLACGECERRKTGCLLPCIEAVSDYRKGGAPAGY